MIKAAANLVPAPTLCREWSQSAFTLKAPSEHHSSLAAEPTMDALRDVLADMDLAPAGEILFPYEPFGLSCGLYGAHFHLYVHTWPEHAMLTLDLLIAGRPEQGESFLRKLETRTGWRRSEEKKLTRIEGDES